MTASVSQEEFDPAELILNRTCSANIARFKPIVTFLQIAISLLSSYCVLYYVIRIVLKIFADTVAGQFFERLMSSGGSLLYAYAYCYWIMGLLMVFLVIVWIYLLLNLKFDSAMRSALPDTQIASAYFRVVSRLKIGIVYRFVIIPQAIIIGINYVNNFSISFKPSFSLILLKMIELLLFLIEIVAINLLVLFFISWKTYLTTDNKRPGTILVYVLPLAVYVSYFFFHRLLLEVCSLPNISPGESSIVYALIAASAIYVTRLVLMHISRLTKSRC